jgi:hypothetical protein
VSVAGSAGAWCMGRGAVQVARCGGLNRGVVGSNGAYGAGVTEGIAVICYD